MYDEIDIQRNKNGFLTLRETLGLNEKGNNTVYDPFSTLISRNARIGKNNVFYPNVTIIADEANSVVIGDKNIFHSMTYLEASGGIIALGNQNLFGPEGGVTIKANHQNASIRFGNSGRYLGGPTFLGKSKLGNGSQVLGLVTVENCELEDGGCFREKNPDLRAAVIKGRGVIRNQTIDQGDVAVVGEALSNITIYAQSTFHPQKTST